MGFDPISYILAKRGLGLPTLKGLIIDTDKNWQGYRIINLGEPVDPNDAARKIYVDVATTGLGINYYLLDAADSEVSAYKQLSLTPPELSEAYVEVAQSSAGDYEIASWIAPADGIPVLRLGVYTLHFQAERVSGNIDVRFFFRLYERDSGGNETLIAESSLSDLVDDRRDVVVSLVLAHDYIMGEGSRLVLKIYARYLSSGPSTTVRLYYQGAVRSRLATPIAKEILDNIYAGITHASRHALGGPDELSLDASQITSGVLSVNRIPDLDASKITSGVLDLARIPNIDWSRISGNFPRDISDLISSAFSRSWISDFFSSPFWDNIPDKPSAFPPEAHSHDAGDITSGTLTRPFKITSGDNFINSYGLCIGGTSRRTSGEGLELYGGTSSAILSVQDGNGRIQLKWNATRGTGETFLVGGENAGMWEFDPASPGADLFRIKYASGSGKNAGDSISWEDILQVGTSGMKVFKSGIYPGSDNALDLGSSSLRWRNGYIVNLYTGDVVFQNGWRITEFDENGKLMDGLRILDKNGEEIFKITEDGLYFKGKKIA